MDNGETRLDRMVHLLKPSIQERSATWYSPYMSISSYNFALQVLVGNTDNDSTKTNLFDPPIVAQYIRIIPVVCRKACTLRMELVGCELNGKHTKKHPLAIEFSW